MIFLVVSCFYLKENLCLFVVSNGWWMVGPGWDDDGPQQNYIPD
jgi:hypothetical protein